MRLRCPFHICPSAFDVCTRVVAGPVFAKRFAAAICGTLWRQRCGSATAADIGATLHVMRTCASVCVGPADFARERASACVLRSIQYSYSVCIRCSHASRALLLLLLPSSCYLLMWVLRIFTCSSSSGSRNSHISHSPYLAHTQAFSALHILTHKHTHTCTIFARWPLSLMVRTLHMCSSMCAFASSARRVATR